ncbi:MAG TPA: hypothetical protein VFA43_06930 [Gemmatimonadaceae bacterium]|nr:hypothetical protein [Gemmatimonadaceae bacterium]
MDGDKQAEQRRRLIFVRAICLSAIDRLDPDDLEELGLITRLQEIAEMIESDLERLVGLN